MEPARERAYRAILSAALLHIKWDLACLFGGFSWLPWRLRRQMRACPRAACRAVAFHNLAIFATLEFRGFAEERFWRDVERFLQRYPESRWSDYRGMFELPAGEEVHVIAPGG